MKHNGRDSGSAAENECAERVDKQKDFQRICVPLFMARVSWQNFGFNTYLHRQSEKLHNKQKTKQNSSFGIPITLWKF